MERVKITVEQEEALLKWIRADEAFVAFINERGTWSAQYSPLNNITPEEFSLMLNGWYEVEEPPFKVGEWVFDRTHGEYLKVKDSSIYENLASNEVSLRYVTSNKANFKKIEEPWKIMLLDLGREKPEFVKGDAYLFKRMNGETEYAIMNKPFLTVHISKFENDRVIEFFPKQDGIKLQGGN